MEIFKQERARRCAARLMRSRWLFSDLYGFTLQLLTAPFRDFFDTVYLSFWTALAFQARHGGRIVEIL